MYLGANCAPAHLQLTDGGRFSGGGQPVGTRRPHDPSMGASEGDKVDIVSSGSYSRRELAEVGTRPGRHWGGKPFLEDSEAWEAWRALERGDGSLRQSPYDAEAEHIEPEGRLRAVLGWF